MQFNVDWLKKWVAVDLDAAAIADRLTASGLEVDDLRGVASEFTDVVVAEIAACGPHPNADKLSLCEVEDGEGELLQIVCGAPNARPGIRVPLARVGARIGPDFKIKRAKLRGVESAGMLCSAKELGLSDDHSGLLELPADAPVGMGLREYLGLDDSIIEVDLTPNRGDCLSIRGLARDVSASCRAEYRPLTVEPVTAAIEEGFPIRLESSADCPRYAGRVIRGIDPSAKTPLWMQETLRRCGLRSISPVVDVTNYVLLELGQPMHAFDLEKLDGEIVVRRGRPGEKLVLLDESEVELDESVLAICDAGGPVALAGIMGGLDSGVTEQTRDILFESAWFNPATIMGKARAYGMVTDASHRFERGVDPAGQEAAVERATALLVGIAGGQPGPLLLAEEPDHVPGNRPVALRHARLNALLGFDLPADEVGDILERLGMAVTPEDGAWTVVAPSSRFDIEIEEDLIEEVARIYGYDAIPEAPVTGAVAVGSAGGHRVSLDRVRESLCAAGYQEAINYSFVDRRQLAAVHQEAHCLPLANPLSSDMDVMRTTLLPGLLAAVARNLRRQQGRVRMFETRSIDWPALRPATPFPSSGASRRGRWTSSTSRVTWNGFWPCGGPARSRSSSLPTCPGCTRAPVPSSSRANASWGGAARCIRRCSKPWISREPSLPSNWIWIPCSIGMYHSRKKFRAFRRCAATWLYCCPKISVMPRFGNAVPGQRDHCWRKC
jgi:phenylalanyl-tRNA synthetase beta chain